MQEQEIEIKILDIDTDAIEQKLAELGAIRQWRKLIVEKAYDFPDKKIRDNNELCRIRSVGDTVEFVYKYAEDRHDGFRSAEELQVEVTDFETLEQILTRLGLSSFRHREKYRTSWKYGDTHIEIDEYPSIPAYLEIEGGKKDIEDLVLKLGYTMADTTTMTGSQTYRHYGVDPYEDLFEIKLP
ncbi:MAG: class IV adenylate cyclase [Candidatus Magasanikbacteria bacterium]|nr:class IV adenylate cyclase [Candidatus Magasanikbacteria bacterium]